MLKDINTRPQLGDKRELPPCKFCGAPQFEVYAEVNCYHNDTTERWVAEDPHMRYSSSSGFDSGPCIQFLRSRIEKLEGRVA